MTLIAESIFRRIPALWALIVFSGPCPARRILSPLFRWLFPWKDRGFANFYRQMISRQPSAAPAKHRRICYLLTSTLSYKISGYTVRTHALAGALHNLGWDVDLETRPGWPWSLSPQPDEGHDPSAFSEESAADGLTYHHSPGPSHEKLPLAAYLEKAVEILAARCIRLRSSLIMATSNYVTGLTGLLTARRLGLPFIYEVRGFLELSRVARTPRLVLYRRFAREQCLDALVAQEADLVLTLTASMREELIRRGVSSEKIFLLPNGCTAADPPSDRDEVLAQELGLPAGMPVIGYVGSLNAYEGLELLIQACGRLREHDFRLILVGAEQNGKTGALTAGLLAQAQKYGIAERVILTGRVPPTEVWRYYSLLDICPFPRLPLPVCELVSPLKPLEAMVMGKAVLVSDVGGMAEMVEHNTTGLRFAKGNCSALTDALRLLLNDTVLRKKLAGQGRQWVRKERSWDAVATTLTRVWTQMSEVRVGEATV